MYQDAKLSSYLMEAVRQHGKSVEQLKVVCVSFQPLAFEQQLGVQTTQHLVKSFVLSIGTTYPQLCVLISSAKKVLRT